MSTVIVLAMLMYWSTNTLRSRILTHKANIANIKGENEAGFELAKRAIALDPNNGYAYFYAGLNKMALDNPLEACSYYEAAHPCMPHLPTLLRSQAQAEYSCGKYDKAAEDYRRYLTLEPIPLSSPGSAYFLYGQSLYKNGDFGQAAIALQNAEKYDDFSTRSLPTRLLSSITLNQPKFAQYLFRKYLMKNHADKITYADIFNAQMALLKPETFLSFVNSIKNNIDTNAGALKSMAIAHAKLGHEQEARTIINQLYKDFKDNPEILLTDADVCTLLGDISGARNAYQSFLQKCPDSPLKNQIETNLKELK